MSEGRSRPPAVEVIVESELWSSLPDLERAIRSAVEAAVEAAGFDPRPEAEVAVLLADDARVRALNLAWRRKDAATNVLSFPASDDAPESASLLGDVVVAFETSAREAREEAKPLRHHLAHLVVHGTLHLIGYDHAADEEADEMERIERVALARLGIPDPYAETIPAQAGAMTI